MYSQGPRRGRRNGQRSGHKCSNQSRQLKNESSTGIGIGLANILGSTANILGSTAISPLSDIHFSSDTASDSIFSPPPAPAYHQSGSLYKFRSLHSLPTDKTIVCRFDKKCKKRPTCPYQHSDDDVPIPPLEYGERELHESHLTRLPSKEEIMEEQQEYLTEEEKYGSGDHDHDNDNDSHDLKVHVINKYEREHGYERVITRSFNIDDKELNVKRMMRQARFATSIPMDMTPHSPTKLFTEHNDEEYHRIPLEESHFEEEEDVNNTIPTTCIVGTCEEMCPQQERLDREEMRDLSIFEIQSPPTSCDILIAHSRPRVDHTKAVKKYKRPAAGKPILASQVRTPKWLKISLDYLIYNIIDSKDVSFIEVERFVTDRFRSIRSDLSVQGLKTELAISIYEIIVRWHVLVGYELSPMQEDVFSHKQNNEKLTQTFISLFQCYQERQTRYKESHKPITPEEYIMTKAEEEMQCLYLLYHLDSSFMSIYTSLPRAKQQCKMVAFAYNIHRSRVERNYITFFKLVKVSTYMQAALLHRYIESMWYLSLEVMNVAYSRISVVSVARYLCFDDVYHAKEFCIQAGYIVKDQEVLFHRSSELLPIKGGNRPRVLSIINKKQELKRYSQLIIQCLHLSDTNKKRGVSCTIPCGTISQHVEDGSTITHPNIITVPIIGEPTLQKAPGHTEVKSLTLGDSKSTLSDSKRTNQELPNLPLSFSTNPWDLPISKPTDLPISKPTVPPLVPSLPWDLPISKPTVPPLVRVPLSFSTNPWDLPISNPIYKPADTPLLVITPSTTNQAADVSDIKLFKQVVDLNAYSSTVKTPSITMKKPTVAMTSRLWSDPILAFDTPDSKVTNTLSHSSSGMTHADFASIVNSYRGQGIVPLISLSDSHNIKMSANQKFSNSTGHDTVKAGSLNRIKSPTIANDVIPTVATVNDSVRADVFSHSKQSNTLPLKHNNDIVKASCILERLYLKRLWSQWKTNIKRLRQYHVHLENEARRFRLWKFYSHWINLLIHRNQRRDLRQLLTEELNIASPLPSMSSGFRTSVERLATVFGLLPQRIICHRTHHESNEYTRCESHDYTRCESNDILSTTRLSVADSSIQPCTVPINSPHRSSKRKNFADDDNNINAKRYCTMLEKLCIERSEMRYIDNTLLAIETIG